MSVMKCICKHRHGRREGQAKHVPVVGQTWAAERCGQLAHNTLVAEANANSKRGKAGLDFAATDGEGCAKRVGDQGRSKREMQQPAQPAHTVQAQQNRSAASQSAEAP
jgi:hypothetical protein